MHNWPCHEKESKAIQENMEKVSMRKTCCKRCPAADYVESRASQKSGSAHILPVERLSQLLVKFRVIQMSIEESLSCFLLYRKSDQLLVVTKKTYIFLSGEKPHREHSRVETDDTIKYRIKWESIEKGQKFTSVWLRSYGMIPKGWWGRKWEITERSGSTECYCVYFRQGLSRYLRTW